MKNTLRVIMKTRLWPMVLCMFQQKSSMVHYYKKTIYLPRDYTAYVVDTFKIKVFPEVSFMKIYMENWVFLKLITWNN